MYFACFLYNVALKLEMMDMFTSGHRASLRSWLYVVLLLLFHGNGYIVKLCSILVMLFSISGASEVFVDIYGL
jgi:hypothetical protein